MSACRKALGRTLQDSWKRAPWNMEWASIGSTFGHVFATAIAELLSCYVPLLQGTGKGDAWLLLAVACRLS